MTAASTPKKKGNDGARARLLDAAARIFRERGYVATTMRAIARNAGIEAGSIYYHFRSKDELISAVLDFGIKALLGSVTESIAQVPEDLSARARIERAIEAHVAAILQYGDYTLAMRRVFGQVPPSVWRHHMRLREEYGAVWHRLLLQAEAEGILRPGLDVTVARFFLLGGLNWTVEWFKPQKFSLETVTKNFSALVLDGLLADESATQRGAHGKPRDASRGSTSKACL